MTTQKQTYNTLEDAKRAKARNRIDHKLDEPKHTNLLSDGRYEVVWVLPDDPQHSKNHIDPNKDDKERLEALGQKIDNDSITQREFIEYERIKRKLGR